MIIYGFVFLISIVFTFFGEKIYKSNKMVAYILFGLSILTLCFFAALRDISVGTDLRIYGSRYFSLANSFDSLGRYLKALDIEYFYLLLTYISAKWFNSITFLLFILQLIPLMIIYKCVLKEDYRKITFALIVYLLLYFNTSLNILRQTPAIFISLIAYKKIQNKEYFKAILYIILASMFHSSALFMFVLFPIEYFSKKEKSLQYLVIISIGLLLLFFSLNILVSFSKYLPMFIVKYLGYIKKGASNLNVKYLLFKIIFELFLLYFYKYYKKDKQCKTYLYFSIFDILFYSLSGFVAYGYRLSYYFLIYHIFFIPKIYNSIDKSKDKFLFKLGTSTLLIAYWVIRYVVIGYDGTIPYVFS